MVGGNGEVVCLSFVEGRIVSDDWPGIVVIVEVAS